MVKQEIETETNISILRSTIVSIFMISLIICLAFYLYPRSAIGNPLCEQLASEGYYETEWDLAGHEDCAINLKRGPETCNKLQIFFNINESRCMSYDESNRTCLQERSKTDPQLGEFGFHCVWGGAGYWMFVGYMMCYMLILGVALMYIETIYEYIKQKKNKIEGAC